jgi:hypothetical protein
MLPAWLDDVAVEFGPVPAAPDGVTAGGVLWSAAPGRLWLEVPGVAHYLARDGRSLTVDPAPGADPEVVARFARATPLAALCYQRGMPVLHGATAVHDGAAVILAGASAAGKSTLLAALVARGWSMLGDDLAPLGCPAPGAAAVLPASAEVLLWPDSIERLERDPRFRRALPGDARLSASGPQPNAAGDHALSSPTPIRSIWWLSTYNEPGVAISDVEGLERFESLGSLAYNGRAAHALVDRAAYLRISGAIAHSVPLRRVRRPRGTWSLEQLADAVEADFAVRLS